MLDDLLKRPHHQIISPQELEVGMRVDLRGDPFTALLLREPHLGEAVTVTDPSGREFRARVEALETGEARLFVFEELTPPTEPPVDLLLLQALPDKERMELIIQKATELGVKVIVPFKSRRSISLEEREARQPKAHRWQHVALRATKQCRRAYLPYVAPYCTFREALDLAEGIDLKIMLYEGERKRKMRDVLKGRSISPRRISLLVGPEGGWEAEEVREASERGFVPVGMGGRVLRTETAAIAACAILMYEWGDLR